MPAPSYSSLSGSGGAASSSFSISVTGTLANGHVVVIGVTIRDTAGVTVQSITGSSMTFTLLASKTQSATERVEIWIGQYTAPANVINPSWTVTLSGNPTGSGAGGALLFTNVDFPATVDQSANNGAASTSPDSGTTSATTFADAVGVYAIGWITNDTASSGPTNSWTQVINAAVGTNQRFTMGYKALSATGAQNTGYTIGTSRTWAGAVVVLRGKQVMCSGGDFGPAQQRQAA